MPRTVLSRAARPLSALPAVLAVLLLIAVPGCQQPGPQVFDLPRDLAVMLPPSPTLLVAAPGLDGLDQALDTVAADSSQGPVLTPDQRADLDPRKLLDEALPGLGDLVDPGRPLALAMVAPPPMSKAAVVTLVVPLQDAGATIPPLQGDFRSQATTGQYLAISTGESIAVQDTVPALARNLEPGSISAALDLAGLLKQYRGLIDMSLGMMAMAPQPDPDARGTNLAALGPDEVQALADMMHTVMDAVTRLDLAAAMAGPEISLAWHLGVNPDSQLAPGPQPEFAAAARLSALLPQDADVLQVTAMDQGRTVDLVRDVYLASVRREAAAMPPAQGAAYVAWFNDYLNLVPRLACPQAVSVDFGEDGVQLLAVFRPEDPDVLADAFARQLELVNAIGLGLRFTPDEMGDLGDVIARRWHTTVDTDSLLTAMSRGPGAAPGVDKGEVAELARMLRSLLPEVNIVATNGLTLLGMTRDEAPFTDLVAAAAKGGGKPSLRVSETRDEAGDNCVGVVVGDLMPVIRWGLGLAASLDGEAAPTLPEGLTLPFNLATTMAPDGYGFRMATDVPAIRTAVTALKAVEARNKQKRP